MSIFNKRTQEKMEMSSRYFKNCNHTGHNETKKGNEMPGECYNQKFVVQPAWSRISDDGEERVFGRAFVDGELKTL